MIMKKNILFFAMSATLLMSSCSDFLDVQPEGDATTTIILPMTCRLLML